MDKQELKFSSIENDELFQELQGLASWFAYRGSNPDNVMLSFDDVRQELMIELIKGLRYYSDKPLPEKRKLVKTMLDHRVQELHYRYYLTHRAAGNNPVQLDEIEYVAEEGDMSMESYEFIEMLSQKLSPESKQVLETILNPSHIMAATLSQAKLRSEQQKKQRTRKPWYLIQPWHVAEVLGWDVKKCKLCFKEIRMVLNAF
jgi:hypothetical protein